MKAKAVPVAVAVAVVVFLAMLVGFGRMEEHGGFVRGHWAYVGLYVIGGKALVAAVVGSIAGGLTWLFMAK